MHCGHCEHKVSNALKQVPNVKEAEASFKEGVANVKFSGNLDMNLVKEKVAAVGYQVIEN